MVNTQLCILLISASLIAACENPASESGLVSRQLSENWYLIEGGNGKGANVGVFDTGEYLVLIDVMKDESFNELHDAVRSISSKPVRYVINTHSDFDHAGGNQAWAELGATVLSQENARFTPAFGQEYFSDYHMLPLPNDTVFLIHQVSHSYDDTIIWFKDSNIIFLGDLFTTNWHPTFYSGGIDGQHAALSIADSLADDDTIIIPGHGTPSHRKDVARFDRNSIAITQLVQALADSLAPEQIPRQQSFTALLNQFNADLDSPFVPMANRMRFASRIMATEQLPRFTPESSTRFTGSYRMSDSTVYEFSKWRNGWVLKIPGEFMCELIPQSDSVCHMRGYLDEKIQFSDAGIVHVTTQGQIIGTREQ